ncbi:MAG TPA: DUF402 domain-containing protein [Plantibacter sp.]|uniref:DUF402 domain-containing protein n=1 Tax=unclassified Plantibacter TaxID=2624265 RepID=UPI002B558ABF|nr:DUF402 domain-containing protein [Plantibacter sp.]
MGSAQPVEPFAAGHPVALRSIREFGRFGVAVGFAVAGVVLVDSPDLTVVCTPVGSDVRTRAGNGGGPNGRLVLAESWTGEYEQRTWQGHAVVRVHRAGDPWSIWRWHDGRDWTGEWYGNLETPWRRTPLGFDSPDWALDVVGAGDPARESWSVRYKDEDELAWLAEVGAMSEPEVDAARDAGRRLTSIAQDRAWPFDADWVPWTPAARLSAIPMPAGWDRV